MTTKFKFIVAAALALAAGSLNSFSQPVLVSTNPAVVSASAGGDSLSPIVSRDGRYVLFSSSAANLVTNVSGAPFPAVPPAKLNVYLYDRTNSTTSLVSVSADGTALGNGDSFAVSISTNGQFVLFESAATNLVAGDTNNANDIFIRDVVNNVTTLVSVGTNGVVGNGASRNSTMTPDGLWVAFVSAATNLVAGDTNGLQDVFARNLQISNTVLVSVGAVSSPVAPSSSEAPDISDNGQYIAFFSTATNLIAGVNTTSEIYVRDMVSSVTMLASTNSRSIALSTFNTTNVTCSTHVMSADGEYVAFVINAKTVVPAFPSGVLVRYHVFTGATDIVNTNALGAAAGYQNYSRSIDMTPDGNFIVFITNRLAVTTGMALPDAVWVWNAQSNTTTLVSADTNNISGTVPDFYWPQISEDGRYVSFFSSTFGLTTNTGGGFHLYTCDTLSNTIAMVDPRLDGSAPTYAPPSPPSVSSNGLVIAFDSLDPNLTASDANRSYDVFVHDFSAGTLQVVSAPNPALISLTPDGPSLISSLSISSNGRYIAFTSEADNLVTNYTNLTRNVFVHDLASGSNTLVSVGLDGFSGNNISSDCAISADGRYVAFTSSASNLVTGDNNNSRDVFIRNLVAQTTTLVSVSTNGGFGNSNSFSPIISADGRYVVFYSQASDLVPGVGSGSDVNVFRRDVVAGTTYALATNSVPNSVATFVAAASPDGRYVALGGYVSGSFTNYVWDMQTTNRIRTNVVSGGDSIVAVSPNGNGYAYITASAPAGLVIYVNIASNVTTTVSGGPIGGHPSLQFSADGRYLLFGSGGSGKTNQIVLYDSQTGLTNVVSTAFNSSSGASSNSDWAAISPDGHFIAYRSIANNLTPNDLNNAPDVFLYNRLTGQTTLVSASLNGNFAANGHSFAPVFSPDSQTLFFTSWSSDVAPQNFNQAGDIYAVNLADTNAEPIIALSVLAPGTIAWPAVPGKNYQAQFKNNVTDANWQPVNGNVTIVGNHAYITDLSPSPTQKFYRVIGY